MIIINDKETFLIMEKNKRGIYQRHPQEEFLKGLNGFIHNLLKMLVVSLLFLVVFLFMDQISPGDSLINEFVNNKMDFKILGNALLMLFIAVFVIFISLFCKNKEVGG